MSKARKIALAIGLGALLALGAAGAASSGGSTVPAATHYYGTQPGTHYYG